MIRILAVLSCLFGISVAQIYDCPPGACLCSAGSSRETALGCLGFCDADGADNDLTITRAELSDVFVSWAGAGATECDEACFLAAHTAFPACATEQQSMYIYFAMMDDDPSSISDPSDMDAWYNELVAANGGVEPVGASGYQAWWNDVYGQFNEEGTCTVPCP